MPTRLSKRRKHLNASLLLKEIAPHTCQMPETCVECESADCYGQTLRRKLLYSKWTCIYIALFKCADSSKSFTRLVTFTHSHSHSYTAGRDYRLRCRLLIRGGNHSRIHSHTLCLGEQSVFSILHKDTNPNPMDSKSTGNQGHLCNISPS